MQESAERDKLPCSCPEGTVRRPPINGVEWHFPGTRAQGVGPFRKSGFESQTNPKEVWETVESEIKKKKRPAHAYTAL